MTSSPHASAENLCDKDYKDFEEDLEYEAEGDNEVAEEEEEVTEDYLAEEGEVPEEENILEEEHAIREEEQLIEKLKVTSRKKIQKRRGSSASSNKSSNKSNKEGQPGSEAADTLSNIRVKYVKKKLPQCRLKRNYVCNYCGLKTQNPRKNLYHLRDEHRERIRIYECPKCLYASKNSQKLTRHMEMVHKIKMKPEEVHNCMKEIPGLMKPLKPSPRHSENKKKSPATTGASSAVSRPVLQSPLHFEEDDEKAEFLSGLSLFKDGEGSASATEQHCQACEFTCFTKKALTEHQATCHLKKRFYRCVCCNYVTNIKHRYTKHMKYHQFPILKCDFCDFRTPYRWNLDRHLKNHTEEGDYACPQCSFKAQIKQSLTVHISNHHLTPQQIRSKELQRAIGISDPVDCSVDEDELELMRMERDEDPEALAMAGVSVDGSNGVTVGNKKGHGGNFRVSNIDLSCSDEGSLLSDFGDDGTKKKAKKPKIKMTFTKMRTPKSVKLMNQEANERHNFETDFVHPDDVVQRYDNVYIKNLHCRFCSFKAVFKHEISRHEKKTHGFVIPRPTSKKQRKPYVKNVEVGKSIVKNVEVRKPMVQIPELMAFNIASDMPRVGSAAFPGSVAAFLANNGVDVSGANQSQLASEQDKDSLYEFDSYLTSTDKANEDLDTPSKESSKKKSFFDKLQDKLSTSSVQNLVCKFCSHVSKCLSESVRHQKLHLNAKNMYTSTRCQYCRHRCKTTDDLINHLKQCPEARKQQLLDAIANHKSRENGKNKEMYMGIHSETAGHSESEDSPSKHPMENRVFVWNNIDTPTVGTTEEFEEEELGSDFESEEVEEESMGEEVSNDRISNFFKEHKRCNKRVYRCPQCNFWATTASRFHVHLVGHLNKKPYKCTECGYRSNWRWDITKHIRLKMVKDQSHHTADVLLTDEAGEKNYEKYEKYQMVIPLTEEDVHRTEGGIPITRRNRPKRVVRKRNVSASALPPLKKLNTGNSKPSLPRIPALPRLTRAPLNRPSGLSPGPLPFGPIMPGAQMMVQMGQMRRGNLAVRPPPPLALRGSMRMNSPTSSQAGHSNNTSNTNFAHHSGGQYQIITQQGSVNTSLETLQLLASGSTNIANLKNVTSTASNNKDHSSVMHQIRMLMMLRMISEGGQEKVSISSTGHDGREVAHLVLDHLGNPEWKCNSCEFRDNERETVAQHNRLAHSENGPISLLHSVHRCDVCGFSAGTKRQVLIHIESNHGGQGGVTSGSEGQIPADGSIEGDIENVDYDEPARSLKCRLCPFMSRKRIEMRNHLTNHVPRPECIFKCMFCTYFVSTKGELFDHLRLHGLDIPNLYATTVAEEENFGEIRSFICDECPFDARTRAKLIHHKQFHRPRESPFKCDFCSYNVTRQHLLSQHMRIHGISVSLEEEGRTKGDRSPSPSPSLTITPVKSHPSSQPSNETIPPSPDMTLLPEMSTKDTQDLPDIPLVWLSRERRFFKMFKCRFCPHVNLRKTNIQEHEKMHPINALDVVGIKCPQCSYVCANGGVMTSHLKVHTGVSGKCHALVDSNLSEEDQLQSLMAVVVDRANLQKGSPENSKGYGGEDKLVYYCQRCPARFFYEKEVQIHSRFHSDGSVTFSHRCHQCHYGARQEAHLLAHLKVHTPEYQQKTQALMAQHPPAPSHPPIRGLTLAPEFDFQTSSHNSYKDTFAVPAPPVGGNGVSRAPQAPHTTKFKCDLCPASFTKLLTLQYHQSLHGVKNPFPCSRCSYSGKTEDNLQQHMSLHTQADTDAAADIKALETASANDADWKKEKDDRPPIKLKLIGLRPPGSKGSGTGAKAQFKYYVEEPVPLSGVDLLRKKNEMEREGQNTSGQVKEKVGINKSPLNMHRSSHQLGKNVKFSGVEDQAKKLGNPTLYYPLYIDKSSGKTREKRYKCHMCPSAFEKVEQLNVHINLHGSNNKYRCRICDYTVKFYANFMMHMNRHKYHDQMEAKSQGLPMPDDGQECYEPVININADGTEVKNETKERSTTSGKNNKENFLTTAERQHLLLQNKKGDKKEEDKKIFYCQYCPYASLRRDAVDSHSCRHRAHGGHGTYRCQYCDYTAAQPNFIREHTKSHFLPFKYVHAEGFMRHDKQEIFSSCVEKTVEGTEERTLLFSHECGSFLPDYPGQNIVDSMTEDGICINHRYGDVTEAPDDYIICIKQTKSKTSALAKAQTNHKPSKSATNRRKVKRMKSLVNKTVKIVKGKSIETTTEVDPEEMETEESSLVAAADDEVIIPEGYAEEIEETTECVMEDENTLEGATEFKSETTPNRLMIETDENFDGHFDEELDTPSDSEVKETNCEPSEYELDGQMQDCSKNNLECDLNEETQPMELDCNDDVADQVETELKLHLDDVVETHEEEKK